VHGVTFDGQHVWFASGDKLNAFDPAGEKTVRSIDVAAYAGAAFDGQHLFQLAKDCIQRIDPKTGRVLATIPAPGGGPWGSGRAWARRDALGLGSIGTGRSINSIPKQGRFSAPSSPTALSPGSPRSTASSGMAPGKVTRAICGASILDRERSWRGLTCRQ
jgi:hypothetical protein